MTDLEGVGGIMNDTSVLICDENVEMDSHVASSA